MRKASIYGIMTIISTLVRQFVLPNPFEYFGDKAILINCFAEPIMHFVAYGIVGLFYIRNSAPALGSFLYLLVYALIVGLLWVLGLCEFAWWAILIAIVVLGLLFYAIHWLKENIF